MPARKSRIKFMGIRGQKISPPASLLAQRPTNTFCAPSGDRPFVLAPWNDSANMIDYQKAGQTMACTVLSKMHPDPRGSGEQRALWNRKELGSRKFQQRISHQYPKPDDNVIRYSPRNAQRRSGPVGRPAATGQPSRTAGRRLQKVPR